MMKTLTLLRHAKSSWDSPGIADRDRPLSKRGQTDAPLTAERIHDAAIRPSLIISSPAERALTTAKIVAQHLHYPMEFLQRDKELYLASRRKLIEIVGRQDNGFNSILLVGHNPGLTEFANYLIPGLTDNLPTCGVISISVASEDWDLRETGDNELLIYDYPKKHA
jgi:phosphohistidine phosphatase